MSSPGVSQEDYAKYRGKCREFAEALVAERPDLRLVRGHYHCPFWGAQAHWWCVDPQGNIVDPTSRQFPMNATIGEYVEFNGWITCEVCSKEVKEEDAYIEGHHTYCSGNCFARDVGLL